MYKFSDIKYIYTAVQLSPPSIFRTSSSQTKTLLLLFLIWEVIIIFNMGEGAACLYASGNNPFEKGKLMMQAVEGRGI